LKLPQDIKSCHTLILLLQDQNASLRQIVEQQSNRIVELEKKNAELETRVKELETRLNQNSRNSHRPPSSDVLDKKKKKEEKPKSKGKQGRQKGHSGYQQDLSNQIDEVHIVAHEVCSCGPSLAEEILVPKERRQVWDIPPPELWITEYQQMRCTCPPCRLDQTGQFPDEVKARIQYGSGVKALVSLLSVNYRLPVKGIKRLFGDLYGQAPLEEPPPVPSTRGKPKQSKGRNLMDRLKTFQDAVLAFAIHPSVPFTNNQAERDIRHTKIKMKISGNINTLQSAQDYATIAAFISTLRKHQLAFPNLKLSIFEQLHLAVRSKFNLDILGGELGGNDA